MSLAVRTSQLLVISLALLALVESANDPKCTRCRRVINDFKKGMEKTAKGNFGGGNTDWERRKLGNYLTSETRFEEIVESLCGSSDRECQSFLEQQEEHMLDWFKNKQTEPDSDLHDHVCVVHSASCCYEDEFGPECKQCPRNWDQVCSGNGACDGAGTRVGSGKCSCDLEHEGELCDKCGVGYYETARNDTSVTCEECHETCGRCNGTGTEHCFECKPGYIMNSTGLCEDINECLLKAPCKTREFCENTIGSFICYECDPACGTTCDGLGPDKCKGECNTGFRLVHKPENPDEYIKCEDIDECKESKPCSGKLTCVNNHGGYDCISDSHADEYLDAMEKEKIKKAKIEERKKKRESDEAFYMLMRRSLVIGIGALCAVSSYFARQYALLALSVVFCLVVLFVLD